MKTLTIRTLLLASALVAGGSRQASARIISSADTGRISDEAASRWTSSSPINTAVLKQLETNEIPEEAALKILASIDRRAISEMKRYALSLDGQSFASPDALKAAVTNAERLLRFNILSSPRAFANGKALTYVVSDVESMRLARGLVATWIEHEPALRSKLDEMVMMQDLEAEDVAPVRFLAREKTVLHAKEILDGMRGAAFFSQTDAEYYLETSYDEEIDRIRIDVLGDAASKLTFLEEARNRYQSAGTTGVSSVENPIGVRLSTRR